MSILKTIRTQLGLSGTATQNFTLDASAADGTMKLARGNAGATTQDVLTVDASGVVTATNGLITNRLILGTAKASTSGTSIDFTGIPSWAKRITVMFNGVSTSGTSGKLVQIGDAGGIENTGYLGGSQVVQGATGYSGLYSTAGIPINSLVAADTLSGSIVFTLLNGNTWTASGVIYNSSIQTGYCAGSKELSATLDRIRITTVNGTDTFDAGSINIMYEG